MQREKVKMLKNTTLAKTQFMATDAYGHQPTALIAIDSHGHVAAQYNKFISDNVVPLWDTGIIFDTNNIGADICQSWIDAGVAEQIGQIQSGFCTYPILKLESSFLDSIPNYITE